MYERVCDFENLFSAYRQARKGKRYRDDVLEFTANLEGNLLRIQQQLRVFAWKPGSYRYKTIYEPKAREICIAPFGDRIVHHALCNVIGPIFEKTFIYDSYACRAGKGTHKAVERLTSFLRKRGSNYVLKGDIRKYFPSISHGLVMRELEWKIVDAEALWLCRRIVDSYESDLELPGTIDPKGIPIGNLTSQWFANIVGNCLDQYVKYDLRVKRYLRYMDDFVILHESKSYLHKLLEQIEGYLSSIFLVLNPKSSIFPAKLGVPFLGYIVYADHRRVGGENVRRGRRRLRKQARAVVGGRMSYDEFTQRGRAWFAHLAHADTWQLRNAIRKELRKELAI